MNYQRRKRPGLYSYDVWGTLPVWKTQSVLISCTNYSSRYDLPQTSASGW